jgi:hypothetical protein
MGWKANWAEISPLGSVQRAQAGEVRKTSLVFWLGSNTTRWASLLTCWAPSGPTGRMALAIQLALTAQRPFPFPQPRKTGSRPSLPQRSPCLAAPSPARASAAARRVETWIRRWGAPRPPHSLPALTHARAARRPANSLLATARGATSSPGARVSPVRAKPWARWGAAGRVSGARSPARPAPTTRN